MKRILDCQSSDFRNISREDLLAGRLLSFELGDQGAFRKIYLTWRKDALLTPVEEKFQAFVQSRPMVTAPK